MNVVEATPPEVPEEFVAEEVVSETTTAQAAPPEAVVSTDAGVETSAPTAPVVADPETVALGEETGKGRRRSRSGGRRRRSAPAEGEAAKEEGERRRPGKRTASWDRTPSRPSPN